MSAVRDYLKTQHLFTMKAFLSSEENPGQRVWFHFDEEGKVTGHSFEPVEKEWDGSGPQPVITPMGRYEGEARLSENWAEYNWDGGGGGEEAERFLSAVPGARKARAASRR